jgi:hypothetical protein
MSDKKRVEKLEEIITLYSEHSSGLSSEIWHKIDNLKQSLTAIDSEEDSDMLFHECPQCNCRCNCSSQPCSCCESQPSPVESSAEEEYKLIPMSKITDEARRLAVLWMECEDKSWIGQKHKLASDIMNYALKYASQRVEREVSDSDIESASIDYLNEADSHGLLSTMKQRIRQAYKQGAKDVVKNNIYIAPK